jgi:G:T-mismatch repair DNA endonuclease (very short patch repair protein)
VSISEIRVKILVVNRDRLTKARRSWNMSRIRGKDTTPEKAVRSMLHRMGYRFRLNVRIPVPREARGRKPEVGSQKPEAGGQRIGLRPLVVRPDIVLPKNKRLLRA